MSPKPPPRSQQTNLEPLSSVAELEVLQQRLGHSFQDLSLLRLALTHPSVTHEQKASIQTNQRLEFLGDAVLGLVLGAALYRRFPDFAEGALSKARAKLVNSRALAARANALELGAQLVLGRGEDKHGGRERISTLSDSYEAVVGAIFIDGGIDAAEKFVLQEFEQELAELEVLPVIENPKGELQELMQAVSQESPRYQVVAITGPDHAREFECLVQHDGVELARGRGKSKREAESNAALAALDKMKKAKADQ